MDLIEPTQDAVFAAIDAASVPGGIRQHVRQDTEPPFNKIGQIDTERQDGKDDTLELVRFDIHSVFRGEERGPLLRQMGAVKAALDGQTIAATGVTFDRVRFVSAVASDASQIDGLTYAGISSFEVWAAPDA